MATHVHSTPVPAPQRGLLRAFAGSRDLTANHREILGSCPPADPLAAPESIAPQPCNASGLAPNEALASTTLAALLEPPEAAEARGLHSRRRLTEALEYGFALLDALDLPPLALDVIDDAIAHLDALDAPREDLEPSLGWTESGPRFCGDYQDCELATADADAVNEDAEDDDPAEETSLETAGRGFVRCGADDAEDGYDIEEQHDAEQTYEDGSDDEPYPWRFQPDAWALVAEVQHG